MKISTTELSIKETLCVNGGDCRISTVSYYLKYVAIGGAIGVTALLVPQLALSLYRRVGVGMLKEAIKAATNQ